MRFYINRNIKNTKDFTHTPIFKNSRKLARGFTLIELLVVIAIIGVLSAVVLASVKSSRDKSKDAAIKQEVGQLVNLMALNYNDHGSFCQLESYWLNSVDQCDSYFSQSNYVIKAREICKSIVNNAGPTGGYPGKAIFMVAASGGCKSTYSISVALNNGKWYLSGGSGRKGEYPNPAGYPGGYNNP